MTDRKNNETNKAQDDEQNYSWFGSSISVLDEKLSEEGDFTSELAVANCLLKHIYEHSNPQNFEDNLADMYASLDCVDGSVIEDLINSHFDVIFEAIRQHALRNGLPWNSPKKRKTHRRE